MKAMNPTCPVCGQTLSGERFIKEGSQHPLCDHCGSEIIVDPAVSERPIVFWVGRKDCPTPKEPK